MCGIFGYTLDAKRAEKALPIAKRERLVLELAAANTRRGGHAWGAYTHLNGESELVKGVGPMSAVPGLSTLALAHTLMAHTRYATTGAVTEDNAHPFHVGHVVGAHNGMIYNHAAMATKYQRTACPVDSMHLFHHIDEGKAFDEFEGYGAIEFVRTDGNTDEVFLCRMQGGELAVYGLGPREKPYGVVWSSSEEHLRGALKAAGVRGFPYSVKTGRVYSASPNGTLYKTDTEYNLSGRRQVSAADLAKTRGHAQTHSPLRFVYRPATGMMTRRQAKRGKQWTTNTAGAPTTDKSLTMRERGSQSIPGVNEGPVEKPAMDMGPDLVEDRDLFTMPDDNDIREFEQAQREGRIC